MFSLRNVINERLVSSFNFQEELTLLAGGGLDNRDACRNPVGSLPVADNFESWIN